MTKITYRISAPKRANIKNTAKDGAELDAILRGYYQLGGIIADLTIRPVVQLGTVGEPVETSEVQQ